MILSFKHKGLKKFYETGSKAGIQADHSQKLRIILSALDTSAEIGDMDLPGFRLHRLAGDKAGLWSVTVNGNWRVTFSFENGNAQVLNYEDYH
jgi:toxin HigB-1